MYKICSLRQDRISACGLVHAQGSSKILCYQSGATEGDGSSIAKVVLSGMKGAGTRGYLGGSESLPPHSPHFPQLLPPAHALCLALARSGRAEAYRRFADAQQIS
jgi:hypothetical protein